MANTVESVVALQGDLHDVVSDGAGWLLSTSGWDGKRTRYGAASLDSAGKLRWSFSDARAVLLPHARGSQLIAVVDDQESTRIEVRDRNSGKLSEAFSVPVTRDASTEWVRRDAQLYAFQSAISPGPTTLYRIDIERHSIVWTTSSALYVHPNPNIAHARPAFLGNALWAYCEEASTPFPSRVCEISIETGEVQQQLSEPVVAMAQEAEGSSHVFLARDRSVEAVSAQHTVLWRASMPEGLAIRQLIAGPGWIVALALGSGHPDRLFCYRANDGSLAWEKAASTPGESFRPTLAASNDRLVYLSNRSPNWRVLDPRGQLQQGGELASKLVVTTEFTDSVLSDFKGEPFLVAPHLLFQERASLHIIKVP